MSELPSNPLVTAEPVETAASIAERQHVEERLDEAVDESFPASDPPAVSLHDDPPAKPWATDEELPGRTAKRHTASASVRSSKLRKVIPAAAVALVGLGLTRLLRRHPRSQTPR